MKRGPPDQEGGVEKTSQLFLREFIDDIDNIPIDNIKSLYGPGEKNKH